MINFKIILICCPFFIIFKLNNGEVFSSSSNFNTSFRSDDYISINRRQYGKIIQRYDAELEKFKELFNERLNTLEVLQELLIESVKVNDEHLDPMEILSDFSKHCVTKYRPRIPTVESTKTAIQSCITAAKNQLSSLQTSSLGTRNNLFNYHKNNFEKEITNCDKKHGSSLTYNYTSCLTNLVATVNSVNLNNQKTFYSQLETSQCSATSHIKKAIDCSFIAQNRTLSLMAEANTLINKCLENLNNSEDFCSDIYYMRQSHIDHKNFSMTNPFFGRNESVNCLLIKLY